MEEGRELPAEGPLLTPREVAEIFGVTASTVKRWVSQGRIPATRTQNGQYRLREAEVRAVVGSVIAADPTTD